METVHVGSGCWFKSRLTLSAGHSMYTLLELSADPQFSYEFPMEYLERVKKTHESGGYGSIG